MFGSLIWSTPETEAGKTKRWAALSTLSGVWNTDSQEFWVLILHLLICGWLLWLLEAFHCIFICHTGTVLTHRSAKQCPTCGLQISVF